MMIVGYVIYLVLFLGGMVLVGIAHSLAAGQALVFIAGILAVSLAMAFAMRSHDSATHRGTLRTWNDGSTH